MQRALIFACLQAATYFAAWPLIVRPAGMPSSWIALFVAIGTILATLPFVVIDKASLVLNSSWPILLCLLAGFVNGLGFRPYSKIAVVEGAGAYQGMTLAMMVVIAALGSRLFYGDALNASKLAGIAVVLIGLWLMSR